MRTRIRRPGQTRTRILVSRRVAATAARSRTIAIGTNASNLFLLKICRPRISGGLRTGPLLIGHGQMAWDRPRDTAVGGSHAGTTSAGEPGASAATRRVEGPPTTTAAERHGPNVLGSAVETIDELAAFVAGGPAADRGWLAPAGISTLLGVEESATIGSARDQCGPPTPDSANELRQSSVGRAKNPR